MAAQWKWMKTRLNALFPPPYPRGLETFYNAGVFCIEANAPHWASWSKYMTIGLANSPTTICDQTVLNYAIRSEELAVHPLPALCNWCCHLAPPAVIAGRFCEPYVPHTPIGVIHMSGHPVKEVAIRYWDGQRPMALPLRYRGTPFPIDPPSAM
jgi:hypothetical protein